MNVEWFRPYFDEAERRALLEVFDSGWFTQGPMVARLETACRELTGAAHCVAVNNGTSALDTALKLLNVGRDDEVIVPAFAYIATANCVRYQDAVPVFADVDPETLNLDPDDVARKITPRTKAIIAIDYAGHPAPWRELTALARPRGIALVEDAAPSFGAMYHGQACTTLADIGITSFHLAKSFTSVEGGMLFLHSEEHAATARMIRSHGESPTEKYVHPLLGHNFRMSELHAAIGLAQIGRFTEVLARRGRMAATYDRLLAGNPAARRPVVRPDQRPSWFLYPILVEERDRIRQELAQAGVGTNVSWPIPVYAQRHLAPFATGVCPVAEWACRHVLCLPLFYELTEEQQAFVCHALEGATARIPADLRRAPQFELQHLSQP